MATTINLPASLNLLARSHFVVEDGFCQKDSSTEEDLKDLRRRSGLKGDGKSDGSTRVFAPPSKDSGAVLRRNSFGLNELRFSKLGLHGRTREQQLLKVCLEQIISQPDQKPPRKQLVFVSGESGTGKTALVLSIKAQVTRGLGGLFAIGKFDLQNQSDPYAAVASTCKQLLHQIIPEDDEASDPAAGTAAAGTGTALNSRFNAFRSDLVDRVGKNVHLLCDVIPDLKRLGFEANRDEPDRADDQAESNNHNNGGGESLLEAQAKLHYAIRQMFRAICALYGPVVVALDDLQWSNLATLALMQDLFTDLENSRIMFVGIYRSNEIDNDHVLAKTIVDLKNNERYQDAFEFTEIAVGNVSEEDIDGIITDLLSVDSSPSTLGLAKLCLRSTQGNVFFTLSFIRTLREKGLLAYNLGLMTWTWDNDKIENEMEITSNVMELTKSKMAVLEKTYQTMLVLASCLGHVFRRNLFETVSRDLILGGDEKDDAVDTFLAMAIAEGYLETTSGGNGNEYRWLHDSFQEAALALMPALDLIKFKHDVGRRLQRVYNHEQAERNIFIIADLLNDFAITDRSLSEADKTSLVLVNLVASKRAAGLSSFSGMSKFAKLGIQLLPDDHWKTHREISLDLYSSAAEADGCQGHEESMMEYGEIVIKQDHLSVFDKMRVYKAYLGLWGLRGHELARAKAAVTLCLDILKQLGFVIPKSDFRRTLAMMYILLKHKKGIPRRTKEEVANLPRLTSHRLREIDGMLTELSLYAYKAGDTTLSGLCTVRQASITLEHGFHPNSFQGFSQLAPFCMVAFNDLRGTAAIAKYAQWLHERAGGATKVNASFCLIQGCFSTPWFAPWQECKSTLFLGYERGMGAGQIRDAIYCIMAYLICMFYTGQGLEKMMEDLELYIAQCALYLQNGNELTSITKLRDCISELELGRRTSNRLVGDLDGQDQFCIDISHVYQGSIHYFFGDHEKGAALAEKIGILLKNFLSHLVILPHLYQQALSLFAAAHKRRKYKRLGLKRHAILKGWAQDGCINAVHYVAILDAELAVLNGSSKSRVEELYQKAVTMAARGGFVHDAAVATERMANYMQQGGEAVEAGRRYEQAIQYYDEWGFTWKAHLLQEECAELLSAWSVAKNGSNRNW